MRGLSRLGSTALIAAVTLQVWGCGSGPPVRTGTAGLEGPVLVVARVKDAVVLDPAQAKEGMSLNVTTEIMKGLVGFRLGTFDVEPAIAQSWTTSPDGRRWIFTLKKGLTFSDGTPIDAAAVKFNFDRWRMLSDPYHANFDYPYYANTFGGFPGLIRDVQAPDASTVVFTLARPFSPFLNDLALPSFAIASPQAMRNNLDGFADHPVGWGPYTLVEWVRGDHITLRANPAYPISPQYKTVVILDTPDEATSVRDMQSSRVDVLVDPRPEDAETLSRTPGVTVYYEPANNNAYLAMNMDRKPFDKLPVRQAIAYALDVRQIVHDFYPASADVGDNWTPPGMSGENPDVKAYAVDLTRARALLASAGYRRGFTTELYYPSIPRPYMPEPKRVADEVKVQLKRIGINVIPRPLEWSAFLEKLKNGVHPMALAGWSGDNGDPDNFLYALLDKDSARRPNALNYAFWRDERFHELMIEGQASSDPATRARIYEEANAMVHEFVPSIPIVHVPAPVAARTSIAGFIPSPDTRVAFEYMHPVGPNIGL